MTTAVQHRRGTTAEHSTFTGLEGEVTIDTTKDTAVIHDGVLAGGYPLAKENLANVTTSGLSSIDGASTASDDKFFIYDQSATTLKTITRAELNNAIEQDALANVAITGGTINGTTIGGTTAAGGSFTTLSASSTVSGTGFSDYLASPPAIGGSAPAAGAFTTLSASSSVTLSGGTANSIPYLNGSKVLTTGSALTFDGDTFGVSGTATLAGSFNSTSANGTAIRLQNSSANKLLIGSVKYITGGSASEYGIGASGDNPIVFATNDVERMRLTSTGLGIGTSSPVYKLDVAGYIQSFGSGSGSTSGGGVLQLSRPETDVTSGENLGSILFVGSDTTGNTPTILAYIRGQASGTHDPGDNPTDLVFGVTADGTEAVYEAMRLNQAGGIVTKPIAGGHTVFNENGVDADFRVESDTSTHALFVEGSSGNVGIGTSSPDSYNVLGGTLAAVAGTGVSNVSIVSGASSTGNILFADGTSGDERRAGRIAYDHSVNNLYFFTNGNSLRATIDSSGNLGLGVTPSAWRSDRKVLDVGNGASFYGTTYDNSARISSNAYVNNVGTNTYKNTDFASLYTQVNGIHAFYTAPSGTAGNAITFTQAMTLDASGNLQLGTTTNKTTAFTGNGTGMTIGAALAPTIACWDTSDAGYVASMTQIGADMFLTNTANGIMVFNTNNTERMRITSSGNVGIGTSSPSSKLQVSNSTAVDTQLQITNSLSTLKLSSFGDGTSGIETTGNYAMRFYTNATERMRLDASGNLGVGTTSPGAALELARTSADVGLFITRSSTGAASYRQFIDGDGDIRFNMVSSKNIRFFTADTERARINSIGNLLVGTTSSEAKLTVSESANVTQAAYIDNTNASFTNRVISINATRNTSNGTYTFISCSVSSVAERFRVLDSGNVQNTNNSYGSISDAKLKENVVDATPKLEKLNQVRVVNYNLIGSEQKQIGVIAQELEQIFPGMVEESPDRDEEGNDLGTTTKAVKYSVFVPMLIKAIQEQQAIINQLKADVAALKGA